MTAPNWFSFSKFVVIRSLCSSAAPVRDMRRSTQHPTMQHPRLIPKKSIPTAIITSATAFILFSSCSVATGSLTRSENCGGAAGASVAFISVGTNVGLVVATTPGVLVGESVASWAPKKGDSVLEGNLLHIRLNGYGQFKRRKHVITVPHIVVAIRRQRGGITPIRQSSISNPCRFDTCRSLLKMSQRPKTTEQGLIL
eukprot:scaffold7405_cov204-Amphora_coffeaeformis.AAC.2